jgi:hypothetical protein
MASEWYFQFFGEELGPVPLDVLRRYADQGSLDRDTPVRRGTEQNWVAAGLVAELFPPLAERADVARGPERSVSFATAADVGDSEGHTDWPAIDAGGPALEEALAVQLAAPPEQPLPWWRTAIRRLAAPWGVSAGVHAALLVILGLWLVPMVLSNQGIQALVSMTDEPLDLMDDRATAELASVLDESPAAAFISDPSPSSSLQVSDPQLAPASDSSAVDVEVMPVGEGLLRGFTAKKLNSDAPKWRPDPGPKGTVASAAGVDGAVEGLTNSIRGKLGEGDTLVVWLFDASLSLMADRQQVVKCLEPFYDDIGYRKKGRESTLTNAVVAFGRDVAELVRPTQISGKVLRSIEGVPIDESGLENVMSAVEFCVKKYRKRWDGGMMLIVWTDESGDDILRLEQTIVLCQDARVQVNVVGPSAVMGSERGTHLYTDPGSNLSFLLPVKRGPETPFPERLFLPYWHEEPLAPLPIAGAQVAAGAPWYGGPHRERLLSGFGPFALTRLAVETGGTFTLLDRPGDRGPFQLEALRPYMPSYGSAEDYLHDLQYWPLRQAVSQAVRRTLHESLAVPPQTEFNPIRATNYPFALLRGAYMPPARFREVFFRQLSIEQARAAAAGKVIEEALGQFGETGMEPEYEVEKSPRWKAWYDLTRGRLLAASVRYAEYALTCQEAQKRGFLGEETNYVIFHPAAELRTSKEAEGRAVEALRLLTRCVEQNPGTPWAALAEWELNNELGLQVEQIAIPMPPPAPAAPAAPVGGGSISLPNL